MLNQQTKWKCLNSSETTPLQTLTFRITLNLRANTDELVVTVIIECEKLPVTRSRTMVKAVYLIVAPRGCSPDFRMCILICGCDFYVMFGCGAKSVASHGLVNAVAFDGKPLQYLMAENPIRPNLLSL